MAFLNKEMWRFVLTRGLIGWGIPTFLLMVLLNPHREQYLSIRSFLYWIASGGIFGLVFWFGLEAPRRNRERFRKRRK